MPEDLRQAHEENDLAVLGAYGFDKNFSDAEIVSALIILIEKKIPDGKCRDTRL